MNYPIQIERKKIEKYENLLNIAINVYRVDENDDKFTISQASVSNNYQNRKCVNLLIYKEHIVGTKNMSVLLKGQITKKCKKRYICEKCNDSFEKEENYKDHVDLCIYEKQKIEMPENLDRCYHSIGAEQYHPYTIHISSDFEATLHKSVMKDVIHEHQPNSFCFDTSEGLDLKGDPSGNVPMSTKLKYPILTGISLRDMGIFPRNMDMSPRDMGIFPRNMGMSP